MLARLLALQLGFEKPGEESYAGPLERKKRVIQEQVKKAYIVRGRRASLLLSAEQVQEQLFEEAIDAELPTPVAAPPTPPLITPLPSHRARRWLDST